MLVVVNKHNTARVASCWFIIYYRLVIHGNSNIKFIVLLILKFVLSSINLSVGNGYFFFLQNTQFTSETFGKDWKLIFLLPVCCMSIAGLIGAYPIVFYISPLTTQTLSRTAKAIEGNRRCTSCDFYSSRIVFSRPHLTPGKDPVPIGTGDWVGLRAGLDRCGKSLHHRDSIPGPSSP